MVLGLARGIRRGGNGEGVRLPDAEAGKAQVEVLSRQPSFMFEIEVEADADVLFGFTSSDGLHSGHCAMEPETSSSSADVGGTRASWSYGLIQSHED